MLKHMPPTNNGGSSVVNSHTRPPRSLTRSIQPLNISTLTTSTSQQNGHAPNGGLPNGKVMNGYPPRMPMYPTPIPSLSSHSNLIYNKERAGAREALTSLGLLCLVSLLLALLSLIFLLKISPGGREPPPPPIPTTPEDYAIVYDVTLALCALSLSLNLCCLLVCAIQFLFAVKLVRSPLPPITGRGNKYLEKSSVSRVCAVGGFFISIPIFLTGIILYTFTQFHSTPAIVTSILIGIGILFCGGAMVHNVFVWQKEKTISVRQMAMPLNISAISPPTPYLNPNSTATSNHQVSFSPNLNFNQSHNTTFNQTPIIPATHHTFSRTTPVTQLTPMSGNHSHISFGHPYLPYGVRTATATPPTPKVGTNITNMNGRDASGSISPGIGPPPTLDVSSVTATNSPHHELSTLV
uniref:CSON013657 protein n=1 Tax=Culicoides sonorensis TaxID=179676 RepID=A0A336LL66_CULSO